MIDEVASQIVDFLHIAHAFTHSVVSYCRVLSYTLASCRSVSERPTESLSYVHLVYAPSLTALIHSIAYEYRVGEVHR